MNTEGTYEVKRQNKSTADLDSQHELVRLNTYIRKDNYQPDLGRANGDGTKTDH